MKQKFFKDKTGDYFRNLMLNSNLSVEDIKSKTEVLGNNLFRLSVLFNQFSNKSITDMPVLLTCGNMKEIGDEVESRMEFIIALIKSVRNVLNSNRIKGKYKLIVRPTTAYNCLILYEHYFDYLSYLQSTLKIQDKDFIVILQNEDVTEPKISITLSGLQIYLKVQEQEGVKAISIKNKLLQEKEKLEAKLNNDNFIKKAKKEVVEQTRSKYDKLVQQLRDIDY